MEIRLPLISKGNNLKLKVGLKGKRWKEIKEMNPTLKNQYFLPTLFVDSNKKINDDDYFWKIEFIEQ